MIRQRLTAVIGLAVMVLAACNGAGEQDAAAPATPTPPATTPTATASPSPTSPTSPTSPAVEQPPMPEETSPAGDDEEADRGWTSCEHPDGITVAYPDGWHVNDGDTLPSCSAFDPEPLNVPDAQEFFGAGVLLSVEPVEFATVSDPDALLGEELDRSEEMVDGNDAVRVETEAQGDALLADGTRSTRWMVVLDRERTLTLATHETGDADEYEEHQEVLDEMVTRLQLPSGE